MGELLIRDGNHVKIDEKIALFETSKTVFEILSPIEGYIYFNPLITSNKVEPGDLLAIVLPSNNYSKDELVDIFRNLDQKNIIEGKISTFETIFSKKALVLIGKNKLDPKVFSGKSIVRERDVLKLLKTIK